MQSIRLVAQKRNQIVSRITKMHLPYSAICVVRATFDKFQTFQPVDCLADCGPLKIKQPSEFGLGLPFLAQQIGEDAPLRAREACMCDASFEGLSKRPCNLFHPENDLVVP